MTTLLLIDVQRDFHPGGSLAIPSAGDDASRTASFIKKHAASIDRIVMTMDSHHKLHVAHPHFWTDEEGEHPSPFTLISTEDVEAGRWIPRKDLTWAGSKIKNGSLIDDEVFARGGSSPPNLYDADGNLDIVQYCIEYTRRLESKGRFKLCIWPEHCLVGSAGHNVVPEVMEAVQCWSGITGGSVEWVHKGENLLTEMYSALSAEVPVDSGGTYNDGLLESLKGGTERLVMTGQALSHCVNYTVRDIVDRWPEGEMGKLTVLEDCASSVPGFEAAGEAFVKDMKEAGVMVETSETFSP